MKWVVKGLLRCKVVKQDQVKPKVEKEEEDLRVWLLREMEREENGWW
jgi:hypothetical protein